jgi:calcium-dependent protein kinase
MGQSFSSCCVKEKHYEVSSSYTPTLPTSDMGRNNTSHSNSSPRLDKKDFKIKSSNFVRQRSCSFKDVYQALEEVGEGTYGKIIKVRHLLSNELRVVKVINKSVILKGVSESDVITEISILKSMDHPNIIKVFEFFSDKENIYIVKEYFNEGDLFNNLTKLKMSEALISNIMKQIISAVSYLHTKKVLHGDLKLENILIETESMKNDYVDIKLTDFGCSKIFYNRVCRKLIGTTNYLAPEILKSEYNEKCDIWSAGVILYTLLAGKYPYDGNSETEIIEKIRNGIPINYDLEEFDSFTPDAIKITKMMLTLDYHERPSASDLLKHSWFKRTQSKQNLIEKDDLIKTLSNLRNFHSRAKFHQAVITFLTHNVEKNEEVKKLRHIFQHLDKDFDGKISIFDLKKGLEEHFKNIAFLEVENIMKNITINEENYIEFEEFLGATLDKNLLMTERKLKEAFDMFDVGKEGIIHAKEIKGVLSREHEVSDEALAEMLNEIHLKIDEDIEYEAFKKLMYEAVSENRSNAYEDGKIKANSSFNSSTHYSVDNNDNS